MEERKNGMEDILHDLFGSDDSSGEEYASWDWQWRWGQYGEYAVHAENPNWKSFLAGLQPDSAKQYVKQGVNDFLEFKQPAETAAGPNRRATQRSANRLLRREETGCKRWRVLTVQGHQL